MGRDTDDVRMQRLYQDGASIRGTAAACGRDPKTVHRRLRAAGVPRRRPGGSARQGPPVDLTPGQVIAAKDTYLAGGISLHDLGTAYKVSGDTIARKLRAAGVAIRPRGRTLAAAPAQPGQEVLRLHDQGLPPRDIAPRLRRGVSPADVARQLRRGGLAPHRRRPIPPPAELAVAYARAGTLRALSRQVRAGEDRLNAALEEAGVPAGSLRRVPADRRADVAALAAAGASPGQISARTGLSPALFPQVGRPAQAAAGSPGAA